MNKIRLYIHLLFDNLAPPDQYFQAKCPSSPLPPL